MNLVFIFKILFTGTRFGIFVTKEDFAIIKKYVGLKGTILLAFLLGRLAG